MKTIHPAVRSWIFVAVGSLLLGGLLSLALVFARAPYFSTWLHDPLFAKRVLVVHVNLTLTCWFLAFITALFQMSRARPRFGISGGLCIFGLGLLTLSSFISNADPILSNYVPVLDSTPYFLGLGIFVLGIVSALLPARSNPEVSRSFRIGISVMTLQLTAAFLTLAITYFQLQSFEGSRVAYFEALFWGTGHLLQYANVSLLMVVWIYWIEKEAGADFIPPTFSRMFFGFGLIPILFAIVLYFDRASYIQGYQWTMRWLSWPGSVFLMTFWIAKKNLEKVRLQNPYIRVGFLSSGMLLALGFVLGASIRGSNTLIPAHYHASIGAVTVSLMTLTYLLLEPGAVVKKWNLRQPLLFAMGQCVFAVGYGIAGVYGQARKTYGADQDLATLPEKIGLGLAGFGGILAISSGGLFLYQVYRQWSQSRLHLNRVSP